MTKQWANYTGIFLYAWMSYNTHVMLMTEVTASSKYCTSTHKITVYRPPSPCDSLDPPCPTRCRWAPRSPTSRLRATPRCTCTHKHKSVTITPTRLLQSSRYVTPKSTANGSVPYVKLSVWARIVSTLPMGPVTTFRPSTPVVTTMCGRQWTAATVTIAPSGNLPCTILLAPA